MHAVFPLVLATLVPLPQDDDAWDRYNGQAAPRLMGTAWVGTPVSLEAVRGNAVVLAFWNADIPC